MLYIVLMKLPLPCYTYAALSIPFLLFPFHFIQFIQISTDCQLHCFAHTNTRDFSVTKNFIWYIYTYMHIYIYTCMYTWNLSEHFFPKHSCSKCNIKYSSVYQLLLWCTELHLHWLYDTLCLCFGPCFYPLSGHKTWDTFVCLIVIVLLAIWSSEVNFSMCAARMGKQNTIYINSSLNYHGVFLSVIITSCW